MTDLVHRCDIKIYEYKFLDTVIGRIFTAQSVQIGHTVLAVTFLLLIFLSLLVYFILKSIYCSSVTVCLHKCTIISVTESAHDMHIINMK